MCKTDRVVVGQGRAKVGGDKRESSAETSPDQMTSPVQVQVWPNAKGENKPRAQTANLRGQSVGVITAAASASKILGEPVVRTVSTPFLSKDYGTPQPVSRRHITGHPHSFGNTPQGVPASPRRDVRMHASRSLDHISRTSSVESANYTSNGSSKREEISRRVAALQNNTETATYSDNIRSSGESSASPVLPENNSRRVRFKEKKAPAARSASRGARRPVTSRGLCLMCMEEVFSNQRRVKCSDGYMHERCSESSPRDVQIWLHEKQVRDAWKEEQEVQTSLAISIQHEGGVSTPFLSKDYGTPQPVSRRHITGHLHSFGNTPQGVPASPRRDVRMHASRSLDHISRTSSVESANYTSNGSSKREEISRRVAALQNNTETATYSDNIRSSGESSASPVLPENNSRRVRFKEKKAPAARSASRGARRPVTSRGLCLMCMEEVFSNQRRVKCSDGYMHEKCSESSPRDVQIWLHEKQVRDAWKEEHEVQTSLAIL